jgi:hypothetical protein
MRSIANVAATSSFATASRHIGGWSCPIAPRLPKGTLRALLRDAGLTVDELRRML